MLEATQRAGLVCYHVEDIGLHYATTLRRWHERWVGEEAAIKALGHDSSFFRKWRFYFSYCEAGFAQQFIHDFQIVWIKPHIALTRWSGGIGDGPQGVRENAYLWLYLLSSLVASKFLAALSMVPVFALTFFALAALCRAVAPSLGFVRLLDGVGTAMWTRSLVSAVFSACAAVLWITCWAVGSFADRSSSSSLDTYCQVMPNSVFAMLRRRDGPVLRCCSAYGAATADGPSSTCSAGRGPRKDLRCCTAHLGWRARRCAWRRSACAPTSVFCSWPRRTPSSPTPRPSPSSPACACRSSATSTGRLLCLFASAGTPPWRCSSPRSRTSSPTQPPGSPPSPPSLSSTSSTSTAP